MHGLGPEDLAAVDVADTAGDVLVEEHFRHRSRAFGVVVHPADTLLDLVVGSSAEIGAERAEPGMPVDVELAVGLDDGSTEADRHPIGYLDHGAHVVVALAPPFAAAVEVPRSGHAHVTVQHEPVVPHDLEVLAVALNALDHPTEDRAWAVEEGSVEPDSRPTDERSPQRRRCPMDRVPLRHGTNLIPGEQAADVIPVPRMRPQEAHD